MSYVGMWPYYTDECHGNIDYHHSHFASRPLIVGSATACLALGKTRHCAIRRQLSHRLVIILAYDDSVNIGVDGATKC